MFPTAKREDLIYDEANDGYKPKPEQLTVYTTKTESQTYKSKILGKTFRFTREKVVEYLDPETGEILTLKQFKELGGVEYNHGVFIQERNEILDTFRSEVREFACFLLKFRNQRRGISPSVEKVVEYFSKFSGKRVNNINARLLPKMYGKVLANDNLLTTPFQLTDKRNHGYSHMQEDFIAENTFLDLMRMKQYKVEEIA